MLFSCYGEQSVNQPGAFIKNPPRTDAPMDTWGVLWEAENTGPDLTVEKRPAQTIQKSNSLAFPLFHPGEDETSTEYRLLGYCLFQLFIKKKSEQENKK